MTRGRNTSIRKAVVTQAALVQRYLYSNPLKFRLTLFLSYLYFSQNEGMFSWVDGSPLNFTDWSDGEPTVNESCVIMRRREDGMWGSNLCNRTREFLCRESKPFLLLC